MSALQPQIEDCCPQLAIAKCVLTYSYVHEIITVTTADNARYALKLYRDGVRTEQDLQWETSLHDYVFTNGAPVVELIHGHLGQFQTLDVVGTKRFATLTNWAGGSEPIANASSFRLLGGAATSFHRASESFRPTAHRDVVDLDEIIDRPLALLKPMLQNCGRWDEVTHMAAHLRRRITTADLNWGICHNDLGLRNVHLDQDQTLIFDLDGATEGWPAFDGLIAFETGDTDCWSAWLAGYREKRDFSQADEQAVPVFALLAQLQRTTWKLGLTDISVGQLMTSEDLSPAVDQWLQTYKQI